MSVDINLVSSFVVCCSRLVTAVR